MIEVIGLTFAAIVAIILLVHIVHTIAKFIQRQSKTAKAIKDNETKK